ncbi:MAG: ABC transporter permease [Planctomycetota bacterium]|nr:ABC transporter permease [Planctomycetota bacterium]
MSLVSIAWKSIRQRGLASSLTALSVALGVMLMVVVLVIFGVLDRTFSQDAFGYHLIVGPKGSELQIVMSTVYRISPPVENVPYQFYLDLQNHPKVKEAVPIALGDYTEEGGFPIVGTISRYFELPYAHERVFHFQTDDSMKMTGLFDAIIGSQVAQKNGWTVGSTFQLVHGGAESDHVHDEKFTVVGVLSPTGTPNDRTVFINLEGFYMIAGHDKPVDEARRRWVDYYGEASALTNFDPPAKKFAAEMEAEAIAHANEPPGTPPHQHHHETPVVMKEVTSILLLMKDTYDSIVFAQKMRRGTQALAVNPIRPMMELKEKVLGNIEKVLLVLTVVIIAVSGVGIFVSIYNSMSDRRREIAIMRALGARRSSVFSIILAESVLLCFGGGVLGLLMGHGLVFIAAPIIEAEAGILIDRFSFEAIELVLVPSLLVLASLVGFVPGISAYRTDVAKCLYN